VNLLEPFFGYLIVLRKHGLVVASLVALVLVGGWVYAGRQEPVFQVAATVQIKPRPSAWHGNTELWIEEDRNFIADQVYRIRTDRALAERVVARVRAGAAAGGLPAGLEGTITAADYAARAAALTPGEASGGLSVQPVEGTSYYSIGQRGREVPLLAALANAYAEEIVLLFREENLRALRTQVDDSEKQWQERRDEAGWQLAELRGAIAALQEAHPRVDFLRRENPAQDQLETLRAALGTAREDLLEREASLRTTRAVLAGAGLALAAREAETARDYVLDPPPAAKAEDDPRLAPAVQALPPVKGDEAVRESRRRIADLLEMDRSFASGSRPLLESAPERSSLRERLLRRQRDLALETEAALCAYARSLDEARLRVDRIEDRVRALEPEARAAAAALALAEKDGKKTEDLRLEIERHEGRLAETARLRRTLLEAGVGAQSLILLVREAVPGAAVQVAPDRPRILMVTAAAAFLALVGLAWLLQNFDDTVKSREDFDRLLRGIPFLGVVPALPSGETEGSPEVLTAETGTPVVESIRALRTTLLYAPDGKPLRTILLTSSGPREGKTTISANLAAIFARGGQRTLLVDGDLRRPRVHRALGVPNDVGLSSILAGSATLAEAARPSAAEPQLHVLPSGPVPPDPAELLSSDRLAALLAEAAGRYDRVIVDSPPIVSVTDPCILARHADAVLLVVAHGRTSARLVRRAREALETVGARLTGAVVNNAGTTGPFQGGGYYGYSYRHHVYGQAKEGGKGSRS
jgi:capsular exopolysaccharide synthesis family protein